jgi:hypothetical protein
MVRVLNAVLAAMVLVLMMPVVGTAQATNIYIAQTAAGSINGSSCANAYAASFFNTKANWGTGASQIGPGTTVNLCGTFTGPSTYFLFQGSGTSGNPITLYFQPGAVITAPSWGGGGAIGATSVSYVVIDGGTNGLINATLAGSPGATCTGGACTYSPTTYVGLGVVIATSSNVEVRNLTIANEYVHLGTGNDLNGNSAGISINSGNKNLLIHNNTIHDAYAGIAVSYSTAGESNWQIYNNTIYNVNWGVGGGDSSSGSSLTGLYIYGNNIHDFANWDTTSDAFHHNGIYVWAETGTSTISNVFYYNNYIHGVFTNSPGGTNTCTAGIFLSIDAPYSTINSPYIFNNVIDQSSGQCSNGAISLNVASPQFLNNTFVNGIIEGPNGPTGNGVLENNIFSNAGLEALHDTTAGLTTSNYNDFYVTTANPAIVYNNASYSSEASYVTVTGFDKNSIISNPNLSAAYLLQAGSPGIQAGTNLTSICTGQPNPGLGALCYDAVGTLRPATGPWDMGAYVYNSGAYPPTNVTVTTQ